MNKISKFLSCIVLIGLLFSSIGTHAVLAQDKRITCESLEGGYNYCRVDTDNNVNLVRKLSNSSCDKGSSWGYDSRGIWVDRGCRAEFAYGKGSSGATKAAVTGAVVGGLILAGVLASRGNKNNSDTRYNDSSSVYSFGYNSGRSDALANQSKDYGR